MKSNLLLIAFLTISFFSCTSRQEGESDGVYQETVEIDGPTKLLVKGAFNLFISQGDLESLTIEGSEDLVKKLKINQNGDVLELVYQEENVKLFGKEGLKVNLTIADLKELEFEGAGNIQTKGQLDLDDFQIVGKGVGNIEMDLDADQVDADLNFVGQMILKGAADQFLLSNEGVGNIDASQFWVQKAEINSSGIGAVSVHCEGELSLEVSGIGTVSYTGNPTIVYEKVSGIGKVNRN
ncbi:head GIN domain-containing protein [Shivajiella indica]|uniref:Head GIN domain-containing protein n=1 Tax=Shivajiella indica TaxID=872115 RepID=A0ABW5BDU7_9BACT